MEDCVVVPIEVKYRSLKKPEIARSLRSFLDKYKPSHALVVNLSLDAEFKVNDTKVTFASFHRVSEAVDSLGTG